MSEYMDALQCEHAERVKEKFSLMILRLGCGKFILNPQQDNFIDGSTGIHLRELKYNAQRLYYVKRSQYDTVIIFLRAGDKNTQTSDIDWCKRYVRTHQQELLDLDYEVVEG